MTNNYHDFVVAIQKQLTKMAKTGLFEVTIDKQVVWDKYLDSFPAGTNNLFRERREYDCNCCKQFIRDVGRVVTFVEGKRVSIWDISVPSYYQVVVDALSALINTAPVGDQFLHFQTKVGTAESNVMEDDKVVTYKHFHAVVPKEFVKPNAEIATVLSLSRSNVQVLERSLIELSSHAAETILELNSQGSLYRGNEQIANVTLFLELKNKYDALPEDQKEGFVWTQGIKLGSRGKFRNTAVGTLLEDLSGGMDIEDAVKRWEKVMAPANYKRPTALITEAMINKAREKVKELGLEDSLPRRHAVLEDLSVNNVLFADRNSKAASDVFGDLLKSSSKKPAKGPSSVEEISIAKFVKDVLPTTTAIEVLLENRHSANLVSLVAPVYPDAPNMLKWDNNFSWSYNGEVTDSIKERVKAAGGKVEGALRVSLAWKNSDDLDLHLRGPNSSHIYYGNRRANGAYLDLDMNGMDKHDEHNPVENIIWEKESAISEGTYQIIVKQFSKRMRDANREGFVVELEHKGEILTFNYPMAHNSGEIKVITFKYSRAKGVEIMDSIGHTKQSKEVWGLNTEQFQKVSVVMNSPNHWDGQATGNKHYFFMLEGAVQPGTTRGFYNEYLRNELNDHRKVFEHLSASLKVPASDSQVSGLGFSETQRNELVVKVTGAFTRTMKVIF